MQELSHSVVTDANSTLSNPRVSDEAKENAKAELERMEGEPSIAEAAGETDKDPGNVARGLKA